jgi:hypothetical protein
VIEKESFSFPLFALIFMLTRRSEKLNRNRFNAKALLVFLDEK